MKKRTVVVSLVIFPGLVLALATAFFTGYLMADGQHQAEASQSQTPKVSSEMDTNSAAALYLTKVNEERAKVGAPALQSVPQLVTAAKAKCDDMVEKGYWGHVSPTGKHGYEFVNDQNYPHRRAGENLIDMLGNIDAKSIDAGMTAWNESPSHRAAMIDSDYSLTGIAVCINKEETANYTVELFVAR